MEPKIKKIQYKGQYVYHIVFKDEKKGNVDFQPFIWGEAFKTLRDKSHFKKAFIDPVAGTISWPSGVDISPETLYKKIVTG